MKAVICPFFAEVSLTGAIIATVWWLVTVATALLLTTGCILFFRQKTRTLGKRLFVVGSLSLLFDILLSLILLRIDAIEG